jgi:hypothetical protein
VVSVEMSHVNADIDDELEVVGSLEVVFWSKPNAVEQRSRNSPFAARLM